MNDLIRLKEENQKYFIPFIEEIKQKEIKTIRFAISGGFDSIFMLFNLYDKFPDCKKYILLNNTLLNMKECKNLVYLSSFLTNIPLIETKPKVKHGMFLNRKNQPIIYKIRKRRKNERLKLYNLKKKLLKDYEYQELSLNLLMKMSFGLIELALKYYEIDLYSKKLFPCCYRLKEKPMYLYYKNLEDKENSIELKGFKKCDSDSRRIFLWRIQKENKSNIIFSEPKQTYFGYPIADFSDKMINAFINKFPTKVYHSGCVMCPVLLMIKRFLKNNPKKFMKFLKENKSRYLKSKRFYLNIKNIVPCINFE